MTYTRKHYPSRGLRPQADPIQSAFVSVPQCEVCGEIKVRKTTKAGKPESWTTFRKRRTCGRDTPCYSKLISGKKNPNYKGIMDIPCSKCGKTGLSYRTTNRSYDMCSECFKTNHPPAWNKGNRGELLTD